MQSDIGINPTNDGKVIRLVFPELTEERRKELVKDVKKKGEAAKVAIRNIRRDANDTLKKANKNNEITEDELKDQQDKVQKATDKHIKTIDGMIEMCIRDSKESVKKSDCEKKAAELAEKGCSIIFSENPEFESVLEETAKKYPKVQFCQEGGKLAKDSELSNFHNYDTRIYEAYHVAGLVAGIKLNHLLDKGDISAEDCVIGFVAYEKNAKTTSCINAFYLGVERRCV